LTDPPVSTADLLRRALGNQAAACLRRAGVNLRDLNAASVSELVGTYGLSEPAAAKTVAVLELARAVHTEPLVRGEIFKGSADIYRHFGPKMRDLRVERFFAVLLDGKHRMLREHLISQGTLTSSPVHPREVFAQAIRNSAAAVVLVHNHPSGDASPSADDLEITRRLCQVGDLVGIRVVDHIICGDNSYTSLADRGLMT
jgi:DNA repair protein RadC